MSDTNYWKHKKVRDVLRFWSKVHIRGIDECWEWKGHKNDRGYGRFTVGVKSMPSHRFSCELKNGTIPYGMVTCHSCDNPSCVNPNHLFFGTNKTNTQDMIKKGRAATGKRHGRHTHPETTAKGEKNGFAKINRNLVSEIRNLYQGGVAQRELARRFPLSRRQIGRIVKYAAWSHV